MRYPWTEAPLLLHIRAIMFPNFDPSKMDPKLMMEISQLVQQLPPQKLNQLQTIMHNMMAGYDVRKELEEFEQGLPPGFREKLMTMMAGQYGGEAGGRMGMSMLNRESAGTSTASAPAPDGNMDLRRARLTILQAVADGEMTPDEAERLLFPEESQT